MKNRNERRSTEQQRLESSLNHRARYGQKWDRRRVVKNRPLKVVILYEGRTGLLRANELWFRITAEFSGQTLKEANTWNFALLRGAQLRDQAARQAAQASILIISPADGNEIPEHVTNWLQSWVPHETRNGAGVSFLPDWRSRACAILRDPCSREKFHPAAAAGV